MNIKKKYRKPNIHIWNYNKVKRKKNSIIDQQAVS